MNAQSSSVTIVTDTQAYYIDACMDFVFHWQQQHSKDNNKMMIPLCVYMRYTVTTILSYIHLFNYSTKLTDNMPQKVQPHTLVQ